MARPTFTAGRTILTIGNLLYSIGAFVADFNETHVYNPRWPPHARFHKRSNNDSGGAPLCCKYLPSLQTHCLRCGSEG